MIAPAPNSSGIGHAAASDLGDGVSVVCPAASKRRAFSTTSHVQETVPTEASLAAAISIAEKTPSRSLPSITREICRPANPNATAAAAANAKTGVEGS